MQPRIAPIETFAYFKVLFVPTSRACQRTSFLVTACKRMKTSVFFANDFFRTTGVRMLLIVYFYETRPRSIHPGTCANWVGTSSSYRDVASGDVIRQFPLLHHPVLQ